MTFVCFFQSAITKVMAFKILSRIFVRFDLEKVFLVAVYMHFLGVPDDKTELLSLGGTVSII